MGKNKKRRSSVNRQSRILPPAFLERMKKMLPEEEYSAFLAAYQKPRHQALRVNTLKCSVEDFLKTAAEEFALEPVPWCPEGFYYGAQDRPGRHPWHEAGMYYIQEPSAMAVAALSGTQPGERILDLCAAPGGKSTQLASMLAGKGILISNEIHPGRAKILSQNIERMGVRNAIVMNEDPETLLPRFPSFFDRIVVDAPCSGEGMFRKEEEAIPNWSPENVQRCAARQAQILDCAAGMLSDGGTLIYSTCTFSREEDEGTIAAFCARHPEFSIVDLPARIGEERMSGYGFVQGFAEPEVPETTGTIRLWPHRLDGEGHFVAVLRRDGERPPHVPHGKVAAPAPQLWKDFAEDTLRDRPKGIPILFGQQLCLLPEAIDLTGLKVLRPGLMLGEIKGRNDRFEPSHSLAMALYPDAARRVCALTCRDPRAAAFLRGESITAGPDAENGWTLVTIDGCSAGWGKCTGGVLKNHYPKGLRKYG